MSERSHPAPTPDRSPQSVRTLSSGTLVPCPVCGRPLQGRQTVCSGKCRIARSRQRQKEQLHVRDAQIRLLLRTARESLDEAMVRLNQTLDRL